MNIVEIARKNGRYDLAKDWKDLTLSEKIEFVEANRLDSDIHGHIIWNLAGNKPAPTGLPLYLNKFIEDNWPTKE